MYHPKIIQKSCSRNSAACCTVSCRIRIADYVSAMHTMHSQRLWSCKGLQSRDTTSYPLHGWHHSPMGMVVVQLVLTLKWMVSTKLFLSHDHVFEISIVALP